MTAPRRSTFGCSLPDAELERRCAEFDIHPTGPLPGRAGKKEIVLKELLRRIPWKPEYREADLNELIKPIYGDYCAIRRGCAGCA